MEWWIFLLSAFAISLPLGFLSIILLFRYYKGKEQEGKDEILQMDHSSPDRPEIGGEDYRCLHRGKPPTLKGGYTIPNREEREKLAVEAFEKCRRIKVSVNEVK